MSTYPEILSPENEPSFSEEIKTSDDLRARLRHMYNDPSTRNCLLCHYYSLSPGRYPIYTKKKKLVGFCTHGLHPGRKLFNKDFKLPEFPSNPAKKVCYYCKTSSNYNTYPTIVPLVTCNLFIKKMTESYELSPHDVDSNFHNNGEITPWVEQQLMHKMMLTSSTTGVRHTTKAEELGTHWFRENTTFLTFPVPGYTSKINATDTSLSLFDGYSLKEPKNATITVTFPGPLSSETNHMQVVTDPDYDPGKIQHRCLDCKYFSGYYRRYKTGRIEVLRAACMDSTYSSTTHKKMPRYASDYRYPFSVNKCKGFTPNLNPRRGINFRMAYSQPKISLSSKEILVTLPLTTYLVKKKYTSVISRIVSALCRSDNSLLTKDACKGDPFSITPAYGMTKQVYSTDGIGLKFNKEVTDHLLKESAYSYLYKIPSYLMHEYSLQFNKSTTEGL